jgi:hypothetical protein
MRAAFHVGVRLRDVRERERAVDHRLDAAGFDQRLYRFAHCRDQPGLFGDRPRPQP